MISFTILIAGLADLLAPVLCRWLLVSMRHLNGSQTDAEKVVVDARAQHLRIDPDGGRAFCRSLDH